MRKRAERIEQLERELAELTDAHSRRHSLQSSMFVQSSACIMLLYVPGGMVTDCSERYLQHTHSERSWIVGRRCFPPRQVLQDNPMCLTQPGHSSRYTDDRVLCKPEGGQLRPTTCKPQSKSTVRLLHQLYSGEVDTVHVVLRCQHGNGRLMEQTIYGWVTEWEDRPDGSRTPLYCIGLVSTSETVCVD